jgi:DNA ligase 1
MDRFSATAEAISRTSKKGEKVALLAEYFRSRTVDEAAVSAIFYSGNAFAAREEATLQAGGALLVRVILEVSGQSDTALQAAYRNFGDLGAAASELLKQRVGHSRGRLCYILDVQRAFRQIAEARGPAAKAALLRELLERCTPLEAKYLVKIITGDLRIGLKASLVEEAIGIAFDRPLKQVQRANMMLGDIGETLARAVAGTLDAARMSLFHPIGFMLATPVESPEKAFAFFDHAQVEDKYDGIRAQAHCVTGDARLYSRTLDEVTEAFPELVEPLAAFDDVILDGEVVAWDFTRGQALPFSQLQKRLGRKRVTAAMMREVPVAYVAFDCLHAGELVIDRSLQDRGEVLDRVFVAAQSSGFAAAKGRSIRTQDAQGHLQFEPAILTASEPEDRQGSAVLRAPVLRAESPEDLERLFAEAQARGNEGLMIKDLASMYTPGRRGRSWLKMKRELATLDVVVTSVEWGHGKRIRMLSDYTFAVRDPDATGASTLLNIGKAYSGLTDVEIADLTQWFLQHTIVDHGFWREVEPVIVLEVAFNAVMRSDRHNSGYALRFPRILRLRPDKSIDDIDTLERVSEIHENLKRFQLPAPAIRY